MPNAPAEQFMQKNAILALFFIFRHRVQEEKEGDVLMQSSRYPGILPPTAHMLRYPPKRYYALLDCAGEIQNYRGTIVYLWLNDGRKLWFYIDFCNRSELTGCYWDGRSWNAGQIQTERILAYC